MHLSRHLDKHTQIHIESSRISLRRIENEDTYPNKLKNGKIKWKKSITLVWANMFILLISKYSNDFYMFYPSQESNPKNQNFRIDIKLTDLSLLDVKTYWNNLNFIYKYYKCVKLHPTKWNFIWTTNFKFDAIASTSLILSSVP